MDTRGFVSNYNTYIVTMCWLGLIMFNSRHFIALYIMYIVSYSFVI